MAPWSRSRLKKKQEPEPEALKYFFFIFCSQYQSKETLDFNQAKYVFNHYGTLPRHYALCIGEDESFTRTYYCFFSLFFALIVNNISSSLLLHI